MKTAVLSALIAVLSLIYILTFVFDPRKQERNAFALLDPKLLNLADRIEIFGASGGNTGEEIVLIRRNNIWFFQAGLSYHPEWYSDSIPSELPVKQSRVDDLLAILSRKDIYPQRAATIEGRERLGLIEGYASRIIVRGGAGLPLLDLLIGTADALNRSVYFRMADRNEIHSGEDRFTIFTESRPNSWYDLRLFPPESNLMVESVQHVEVTLPGNNSFFLRRGGGSWIIPGNESAELDNIKVEAWLRSVLEAEGEDFGELLPTEGGITLGFGDGTIRIMQFSSADENKRRNVTVSGSPLTYILSEWTVNRLFRESSYFYKTAR